MFKWIVAFLILVYVEWQVWFWASDFIGGLGIFFATIFAAMYGLGLFKKALSGMQQNQAEVLTGSVRPELANKIPYMVGTLLAGVLFLLPGLLTDVLGAMLLLPPVQKQLAKRSESLVNQRMQQMGGFAMFGQMMKGQAGSQSPEALKAALEQFFAGKGNAAAGASTIIDGQARDVSTDTKQINHTSDKKAGE